MPTLIMELFLRYDAMKLLMPITISGGFDPKKCLNECEDEFDDLFC